LLRWLGTLLAVALLVYLLAQQGWDEILSAIRQIAGWRFVAALLLMVVSRLAVAGRWHVLMRSARTGISFGQSLRITLAGLFASNFLPTTIGGDVVRLGAAIRLGYDRAVSIASLVADRLVGMAGMAMALPFGIPAFLGWLNSVGGPAASASLPSILAVPWLGALWERLRCGIRRLLEALQLWLRQPRALLGALGCTWIHMLCTFAQVWLLLGGMDESISFWAIAGLWSATYFVTLLPISINGMGVQELSMTFFYTTLGGISRQRVDPGIVDACAANVRQPARRPLCTRDAGRLCPPTKSLRPCRGKAVLIIPDENSHYYRGMWGLNPPFLW
jgi:uncharacterized membrane protein YbhN (UPF0104 family)